MTAAELLDRIHAAGGELVYVRREGRLCWVEMPEAHVRAALEPALMERYRDVVRLVAGEWYAWCHRPAELPDGRCYRCLSVLAAYAEAGDTFAARYTRWHAVGAAASDGRSACGLIAVPPGSARADLRRAREGAVCLICLRRLEQGHRRALGVAR